jgi:elongation factor 1-beta
LEAGCCSEYVFLFVFVAKLVPVGFGINKLQIMCVVEDEKVSVDFLIEEIQKFEHHVQSVDIVAFNKI